MRKAWVKALDKLGMLVVELVKMSTQSTGLVINLASLCLPSPAFAAGFTHKIGLFTQPKTYSTYLSAILLYPVSTEPITNTKLI